MFLFFGLHQTYLMAGKKT